MNELPHISESSTAKNQREKVITKLKADRAALRETLSAELVLIRTAMINGLPITETAIAGENGIQNSQILRQAVFMIIVVCVVGCLSVLMTAFAVSMIHE